VWDIYAGATVTLPLRAGGGSVIGANRMISALSSGYNVQIALRKEINIRIYTECG